MNRLPNLLTDKYSSKQLLLHQSLVIACLFLSLFPSFYTLATTIPVENETFTIHYGQKHHDDVFSDTLYFEPQGETAEPVVPIDADVTCDCITFETLLPDSLHPTGGLALGFHVEPEEKFGLVEKVVYVFTTNKEFELLRIVLQVEVVGEEQDVTISDPVIVKSSEIIVEHESSSETISDDKSLKVYFFESPGCQSCRRVKEFVLPQLEENFGDRISVVRINIEDPEGYGILLKFREHYGDPDGKSPFSFYVGESVVLGRKNLAERLNEAIDKALEDNETTFVPQSLTRNEFDDQITNVFNSITFWAIVGAGLLDGINPCAFATIVFFISLLGYTGSSKRQMLQVGIGFTVSVFAVYLLLGIGAFKALQALQIFGVISQAIYAITFILLVVLFIVSVRDTVRYYSSGGKTTDQVLQLSSSSKRRIHNIMKKGLKTRNLLIGAIGIGILVSLFEAACTGQVYLPTIVLVLKDPELRNHAFLYLILYNLLFIAPLILVFSLAYGGVASERFGEWSKRNFGFTRIALSLLFLALAILMGIEWIGV